MVHSCDWHRLELLRIIEDLSSSVFAAPAVLKNFRIAFIALAAGLALMGLKYLFPSLGGNW